MRKIGINTFGLKELLHKDFEGTFRALKEIGFSTVEPLVVFSQPQGLDPASMADRLRMAKQEGAFWVSHIAQERIRWLRVAGFQVEGVQLGLVAMIPGGLDAVLPYAAEFAKENVISYLVHSPQKKTIAEIRQDVSGFRKGVAALKESGTELLFHCHYQEFMEDQGDTPFSYLLREVPELRVELDVGWVKFAKKDVLEIMEQYRDRIATVHLKDITAEASPDNCTDCFTAIGEGCIPLEAILRKSAELDLPYTGLIIDQDASLGDMLTDLQKGIQNVLQMEKQEKSCGLF